MKRNLYATVLESMRYFKSKKRYLEKTKSQKWKSELIFRKIETFKGSESVQ